MKILMDTHIIIWVLNDNPMLPIKYRDMLLDSENHVYFSTASIWEIAIKHSKNPEKVPYSGRKLYELCYASGYEELKINSSHAIAVESLKVKENETVSGDPFDRIIIAQAKTERMSLYTHDSVMIHYDEPCIEII